MVLRRQNFGRRLEQGPRFTGGAQEEGLEPPKDPIVTPRRVFGLVALSIVGGTFGACANKRVNSIVAESNSQDSKEVGNSGK